MNPSLLSHSQIVDCIDKLANLSDDAAVEASFAALYLGISTNTLARYRQRGEGPPYFQYPTMGSKARNQKITYKMQDLRVWRDSFKIKSTMDAAVRRGMAFGRVNDLLSPQPFWLVANNTIFHALDSDIETFANRLKNQENFIIWLSWPKVFNSTWNIPNELNIYKQTYTSMLSNLLTKATQ